MNKNVVRRDLLCSYLLTDVPKPQRLNNETTDYSNGQVGLYSES